MCTAITYKSHYHYFGRNLDLEFSYGESVAITPRKFVFEFRNSKKIENHYAIIGMAITQNGFPLYFDATNEKGLSAAALNFPGNAIYHDISDNADNIASFELIPWVLCQCKNIQEAKNLLENTNITKTKFSIELPPTPIHWIICDSCSSITVETVDEGLKVYDNPVGVLTNNPGFDIQLFNLNNFLGLSAQQVQNRFSDKIDPEIYSQGMGAIGLPGDLSSSSRFVRACFTKLNSISEDSEYESISQFFHILASVWQQRGCVKISDEKYEITLYSSCCNTDKGIYYYMTYENFQISAIDMHKEDLDSSLVISYPLIKKQQINYIN